MQQLLLQQIRITWVLFEKLHTEIPVGILTNSIQGKDQYKAVKYESVQGFWTKPLKVEQVEKMLAVN